MEKYLLIDNFARYDYDSDDLTSTAFVIGDFATVGECVAACEGELLKQGRECAPMDLEGAEREAYAARYAHMTATHRMEDSDFAFVKSSRCVFEHWHNGVNYRVENQFMVIRIS